MIVYELCCSSLQALASERASPTSCVGGGSYKTVDSSDRQLKVPVGDLLSISHDLQVTSADLLATQELSAVTCHVHGPSDKSLITFQHVLARGFKLGSFAFILTLGW